MPTMLRATSDRMAVSRIFGHVNPDTYSPQEYAETLAPLVEAKLRTGPIKVVNNSLDPHNRGVALTLVCAKTFTVRPPVHGRVSDANVVLHEHGQPSQSDFNEFIGELFDLGDKLTTVSLVDSQGQSYTFNRGELHHAKASQALYEAESGPLDLSALSKPRLREGVGHTAAPRAGKGSLNEAVQQFIGETHPSTITAATKLLANHTGSNPQELGYQAFLRRTLVGKDTGHLMRAENIEVRRGALAARADLSRMAAALTQQNEGCDPDDDEDDDDDEY